MRQAGLTQPLVVANDWGSIEVPPLGGWSPERTVTVVIPAYNAPHLPLTLAALAAQSYPKDLLDVIVVDDGSDPPVTLPPVRPRRTRLMRTQEGWGRAAACHTGAEVSDGEVLHWLDADMVPDRFEVEAQMRWHHVIDYAVVLAHKWFSDERALDHLTPDELRTAVAAGDSLKRIVNGPIVPHAWVEKILRETDDLRAAGPRAMRVHVGASASVDRTLYDASGGMPTDMKLGEDIVLGYRLREAGAVFVPDRESRALHLGPSTVDRKAAEVQRYNRPYFTARVPEFRAHRRGVARSYEVPYLEVILDARDKAVEEVRLKVERILEAGVPDAVITLLGDWDLLTEQRRDTLIDDVVELRLVSALYAGEARVRLRNETLPLSDATFRLDLSGTPLVPARGALGRALRRAERRHAAIIAWSFTEGEVELNRTATVARALRCGAHVESGQIMPPLRERRLTAAATDFVDALEERSEGARHGHGRVPRLPHHRMLVTHEKE